MAMATRRWVTSHESRAYAREEDHMTRIVLDVRLLPNDVEELRYETGGRLLAAHLKGAVLTVAWKGELREIRVSRERGEEEITRRLGLVA